MTLEHWSYIISSEALSGSPAGDRGRGQTGLALSPSASWTLVGAPHLPPQLGQRSLWQERGSSGVQGTR